MSLVFSAIVPHPPILIPSIGKEHIDSITATKSALEHLEQDLYATKPDTLIIISPHGQIQADSFTININAEFRADFKSFGDFTTVDTFDGDTTLLTIDKERISDQVPINIISDPALDHGVSIPLYYLTRHLPNIRIIPIGFSFLDNQSHLAFGQALKETILSTDKRVAVIASADLSHCLTEKSPLPFNPAGKEFDDTMMRLLANRDTTAITNLDQQLVERAGECGLRSIIILLGTLSGMNYQSEIISYEAPFGVGYPVVRFVLE